MDAFQSETTVQGIYLKVGKPIGPLDMMIAGHAKSLGYIVVTNNTKQFMDDTLKAICSIIRFYGKDGVKYLLICLPVVPDIEKEFVN